MVIQKRTKPLKLINYEKVKWHLCWKVLSFLDYNRLLKNPIKAILILKTLFLICIKKLCLIVALYCTGDPDSVAGEFGRHSLYKMLGYFSLVGLLRLHSLLGDYYQGLKVLENIDFNKKVFIIFRAQICSVQCCLFDFDLSVRLWI